jgi:hypothetical protein
MARPTKLTPAIHKAIVRAVSRGVPLERASALVQVDQYTVLEWIRRGEGREGRHRPQTKLYAQFACDIQKARAQDEARRVARINAAGQGGTVLYESTITYPDGRIEREVKHAAPQWQADAWHLERSRPEAWGRRDRLDLTVTIEQMVARIAQETGLTSAEILAEAQLLLDAPRHEPLE